MMSENQVVNSCIKYLHHIGCFIWRNNTGAYKTENGNFVRYGHVGSADIIGMTPTGRFLAVEAKFKKRKPTDPQIHFGQKVIDKNGIYVVAYSVDDLKAIEHEILNKPAPHPKTICAAYTKVLEAMPV